MEKEPYKVAKELLEKYEPTHPTLSRTVTPQDNDNSSGEGTEREERGREGGGRDGGAWDIIVSMITDYDNSRVG